MDEKKDKSTVIKIRFPVYLYDWVKKRAKIEMRPVSKQIAFYVDKALQEERKLYEIKPPLREREKQKEQTGGEGG